MAGKNARKVMVSGLQPTGRPHIGNYFGAMKQFVTLQNDFEESYIFIANYHALTTVQDKKLLEDYTLGLALDYLAIGLDPKKVNLFLQSDVPEHTELCWIFDCITMMPYLMRAHAFKDADQKTKDKNKEVNVGLFNYPMLMAADILIYDGNLVPVGADQKQHVEYARDTAEKFNRVFGETFKLPEPYILESVATVLGTDGRKMSKSYGNTVELFDSDENIKKAVMSIKTDSKGESDKKDPETCIVFGLHRYFSEPILAELEERYRAGTIGYRESKEVLARNIIEYIRPMREKREQLAKDPDSVRDILHEGGKRARARAEKKMADVREKVGLAF